MIKDFFTAKDIAVAGASRNPAKFGNLLCSELIRKGHTVYPVNPSGESICGLKTYADIASLPDMVTHLIIITRKDRSEALVLEAIRKGIKHIWIQQQSDTPSAVDTAVKAGVTVTYGKCAFMYLEPVTGIHNFHKKVKKLFCTFTE